MSLSTHVLDTAKGAPAAGVAVRLSREAGGWSEVASGVTDADGRLRDWVSEVDWVPGRYRLAFETGGPFFPVVTVEFVVADTGRHYHVPVLLSPYGYTTYLGS
jgi:5-hydroxyisourate hydrolase